MSILTDVEMELPEGDTLAHEHAEGWVAVRNYARALEVKLLEKLAGMELPEPYGGDFLAEGHYYYTAEQLHQAYAQGAASQLSEKPVGVARGSGIEEWTMAVFKTEIVPIGTNMYVLKAKP